MRGRLGGQKGFTLIELSIVLVIIGIILAAVLKGQDLLISARTKQLTTNLQAWQIAVNNYMDLTKRLPGDSTNTGIIGGTTASPSATGPYADINTLSSPPPKLFTLGVNTYYVFLGNDGAATPKNILLLCVDTGCANKFNSEELKMAASFASTIDSVDDAKGPYDGATPPGYQNYRVYGIKAGPGTPSTTTGLAVLAPATVTANVDWLTSPTDIIALVYLFQ